MGLVFSTTNGLKWVITMGLELVYVFGSTIVAIGYMHPVHSKDYDPISLLRFLQAQLVTFYMTIVKKCFVNRKYKIRLLIFYDLRMH